MAMNRQVNAAGFAGLFRFRALCQPASRSRFGDFVLLVFLLAQCFDGVFTYVGVSTFGTGIEGNPLIASLMLYVGHGAALMGAKTVASLLGIALHLLQTHVIVAMLTVLYVTLAIVPWAAVLFLGA